MLKNDNKNKQTVDITQDLISAVTLISQAAGELILDVYNRQEGFDVDIKGDSSPITEADRNAHHYIVPALQKLTPSIPILSEESTLPTYAERSSWYSYWLIDPLDGTKEFVNRNDEFTVNIALIENGIAVLGVVYVPVTGVTYVGSQQFGAFKYDNNQSRKIHSRTIESRIEKNAAIEIVASRRHGNKEVDILLHRLRQTYSKVDTTSIGSSLKLCLIAEGKADLYPRYALTSEWDTAAAQAVVEAAGGIVVDTLFSKLRYNEKDDILNPHFLVIGDPSHNWKKVLSD